MSAVSYEPAPLTITSLIVENVKRLKSVRVTPAGALVVVGGRNAQGKSSLLDAIEMAIGGGSSICAEPIRRGARTARIVADLGDLVVERTFTAKGTQLVVKNAQGVPQKSPQALLDALCSRIAFDPLAFERMPAKEQARVIRELDSDTAQAVADLDARRADAFLERTEANRAAKAIAARLDPMVHNADAPDAEVSVASLAEQLEAGLAKNKDHALAERRIENEQRAVDASEATIHRLEEDLARERARRGTTRDALLAAQEALALTTAVDVAPIQQELRGAEATNRKVRANKERALVVEELATSEGRATLARQHRDRDRPEPQAQGVAGSRRVTAGRAEHGAPSRSRAAGGSAGVARKGFRGRRRVLGRDRGRRAARRAEGGGVGPCPKVSTNACCSVTWAQIPSFE